MDGESVNKVTHHCDISKTTVASRYRQKNNVKSQRLSIKSVDWKKTKQIVIIVKNLLS